MKRRASKKLGLVDHNQANILRVRIVRGNPLYVISAALFITAMYQRCNTTPYYFSCHAAALITNLPNYFTARWLDPRPSLPKSPPS